MAAKRLHIDSAAPAVPATTAARVEGKQMQTAATATSELSTVPSAAANEFDVAMVALKAWGAGTHQAAAGAARGRAATVAGLSTDGFSTLAAMNSENAAALDEVGHEL